MVKKHDSTNSSTWPLSGRCTEQKHQRRRDNGIRAAGVALPCHCVENGEATFWLGVVAFGKQAEALFPMYHLREWIYQGKIADHRTKNNAELTPEEKIDKHLLALAEYQIVRSLCNHSKHYKTGPSNKEHETVEIKGPRAGLMRCGDSLGMSHFIVDGRDIRDIFVVVYRAYYEYFESLRSNS